jgi:hypothetical protein
MGGFNESAGCTQFGEKNNLACLYRRDYRVRVDSFNSD